MLGHSTPVGSSALVDQSTMTEKIITSADDHLTCHLGKMVMIS
jgi:hypothetical protein